MEGKKGKEGTKKWKVECFGGSGWEKGERRKKKEKEKREGYICGVAKKRGKKRRKYRWKKKK